MPITKEDFDADDDSHKLELPSHVKTFARVGLQRCSVCKHPNRATFEKDYFERRATAKAIATDLHISEDQVSEHMRLHVKHEIQQRVPSEFVNQMANELPEVISKLETVADKLYTRANSVLDTESIDPATVMAMKAFSSEFREYIKLLGLLKGEISQTPTVNINQMNVQYNDLKNIILTKLCPVCRKRVLEAMETPVQEVC